MTLTGQAANDRRYDLQHAYQVLRNQRDVLAALAEADLTGMLSNENWGLSHDLQKRVANDIVANCAEIARLADLLD